MPKNKLVFHHKNGALSLQQIGEKGEVISSEIIVRFVYADRVLLASLIETVRKSLISRGIVLTP